jgi:hypothetical protein
VLAVHLSERTTPALKLEGYEITSILNTPSGARAKIESERDRRATSALYVASEVQAVLRVQPPLVPTPGFLVENVGETGGV